MVHEISDQDLAECDAEPIHLIGSIRPSGCLLAVHRQSLVVHYVSDNVETLVGVQPKDLLGRSVRSFISEEVAARLLTCVRGIQRGDRLSERYRWNPSGHEKVSLIHLAADDELVIIEIILQDDPVSAVTDRLHRTVDLKSLGEITDLGILMDQVAGNIRKFTEFDRVMVYRFAEDGSGHVAAESCRGDLESFLGLHYPASDIPAQARRLFIKNRVRVVEDVRYTAVPLVGLRAEPEELDLSGSMLRSVSPIHLRYLDNMGVGSSLAISLVRDGELWGMIACHHYSAKSLPPCMLGFTEMLSQVLSVMADRVERANRSEYATNCVNKIDKAMQQITEHEDGLQAGIIASLRRIANAVNVDGVALIRDTDVDVYGDVPEPAQLSVLPDWLGARDESVVVSESLKKDWPEGESKGGPAGLLAFRWGEDSWLVLFRNEIVRSVFWAGDPNKSVVRDTDGRLSPRGSFEAWKDDVRGWSKKWLNAEIDALRPLRRLSAIKNIAESSAALLEQGVRAGSHDPVLIVDLQGVVVDWNYAVEQRFGISDIKGRKLISMLPIVPATTLNELITEAAKGDVWVGEYQPAPDEGLFEVVVFPISAEHVKADRVGVAMRDVSERKLLEQQLQRASQLEALGQLTSGMVHNFNNLLTVILSSTEVALSHLKPDHASYSEVRVAQTACVSAAQIVRDMMMMATDQPSHLSGIDVRELVNDQRHVVEHLLPPEIRLQFDVGSAGVTASANRSQLEQVLINLVVNARDAIDGEGSITIRVYSEHIDDDRAEGLDIPPANYVVLSVQDTGNGIDAKHLDRIFDPFFTTKVQGKGTGLGLASVDKIVQSFGGAIRVRSGIDRGTQFIVYLPQTTSSQEGDASQGALNNKMILVVDDQASVAASLSALLQIHGCEVQIAKSATEAQMKVETLDSAIDLLITDQTMPDMSGLDLIAHVRQRMPYLPIILMSGGGVDTQIERVTFLRKPFDPSEFLRIVEHLVSG